MGAGPSSLPAASSCHQPRELSVILHIAKSLFQLAGLGLVFAVLLAAFAAFGQKP